MSVAPLPITVFVKPAAALVANSVYTLSNTTVGDIPTATIAGVNGAPHLFVGDADTFYNATPGKSATAPYTAGDTFAVVVQQGVVNLRATAAITEGVEVATDAGGTVSAAAATDRAILGVTLGAQATAGGLVSVLQQVRQNPAFVPV